MTTTIRILQVKLNDHNLCPAIWSNLEDAIDFPLLAWIMDRLLFSFGYDGRPENALFAARASVNLYRAVGEEGMDMANVLAGAIHDLSIPLSALGYSKEALEAARESVKIRRRLARDRPTAFSPNLANSLNMLSLQLSALGYYKEALTAVGLSSDLYRDLAKKIVGRIQSICCVVAVSSRDISLQSQRKF